MRLTVAVIFAALTGTAGAETLAFRFDYTAARGSRLGGRIDDDARS